ncbi:RBCC1 protein, partial [Atractosteus spatula]|nr:RBCC1 protein [Atractosteus spatula]
MKLELESLEQSHLKDLAERLQAKHGEDMDTLKNEHQVERDALIKENMAKLDELLEVHRTELRARESHLKELELRISELSDMRCKLEVEMALKEAETEEIKLLYEESKSHQEETINSRVKMETNALRKEIGDLKQQLQTKNDEYEVGIAELRTLMRIEKDHCISELVDRHEEETTLLHSELSSVRQKALDTEKALTQQVQQIQSDLENHLAAHKKETEENERAFQEQQQQLKTIICQLQAENELLSNSLAQVKQTVIQSMDKEKEEAVKAALSEATKEFEHRKGLIEEQLLERVKQLENQLKEKSFGARHSEAISEKQVLDTDLQERLQEESVALRTQLEDLEKRKNEELQTLKTSLIAEQQTNFNTVLTREKMKKEQIINELNDKLKKITEQQERDKDLIETLSKDRAEMLQEKKKLEEELNRLRSSALVSSAFFSANQPDAQAAGAYSAEAPVDSERLASVAAIGEDGRIDPAVEASMMAVHENITMLSEEKQRILLLERTLHMKEEENKRLNQRLMSQSMSSVSSRHSEKIAIRDFQVGDLVLIILDERHDNYVLFTVGPTLYFLHSESLTALDLKPASGTPRRPWVLGKVMEKEYCQAKKALNRFKVPLGTKFYRVKAVPWNKKV